MLGKVDADRAAVDPQILHPPPIHPLQSDSQPEPINKDSLHLQIAATLHNDSLAHRKFTINLASGKTLELITFVTIIAN